MTTLTRTQLLQVGNFDEPTVLALQADLDAESALGDVASNSVLGRVSPGSGAIEELTNAQLTSMINTFTSVAKGSAPASGGGTTNFLRADGTWAAPPGASSSLGWYNVLSHGLVADGVTDNKVAMATLITTVLAAGGGTIYFPTGTYYFSVTPGAGSIQFTTLGVIKLRFLGDGKTSKLTWGGNSSGADSHLFQLKNGVSGITFEKLYFVQKDLTNPDPAEQHHCIQLTTSTAGDCSHVNVLDCDFGVFKGDGVFLVGGVAHTACHTGFAANVAAGAISGTFTSPSTKSQRMVVGYPLNWDGGSITITGTNDSGITISEVIPALVGTAADRYIGYLYFKTVTGATKSATGATAGVATIGFAYEASDVNILNCRFNGFEYEGTNPGYGFRGCVVAQRLSARVRVQGCRMTGSSDQLIDFEPTGNGNLGPWWIEDNVFLPFDPNPGSNANLAVTLTGNGNASAGTLLHERSRFARNTVYGQVLGGKMKSCDIVDNIFIIENISDAPDSILSLTETLRDVRIERNRIIGKRVDSDVAIRISEDTPNGADGLVIRGNIIEWCGEGACINVEAYNNIDISDNQITYTGVTTATYDAILVQGCASTTSSTMRRVKVTGNLIKGDGSTGTLRYGVNLAPGSGIAVSGVDISHNSGTGIATRGVSIPAPSGGGSYASPPRVMDNDFATAATPVNIGAGVTILVGGNAGGVSIFRGTATPEGAITAPIGSMFLRADGGAATTLYIKESGTGNTGWVGK